MSEIDVAIDELQVEKTPGPDGLDSAVYIIYETFLAQLPHRVLTEA